MTKQSKSEPGRGSRGPPKGEGGRPRYALHDDPDRLIVIAALWFWDDVSALSLQMLDFLFAPHDSIEFEFGTRDIDGVQHGVIGVVNTRPERTPDKRTHRDVRRNIAPDHRPLSAPSGKALRRSRIDLLRRKVNHYRTAALSAVDAEFCRAAFRALAEFQVIGEPGPLLDILALDERARARLLNVLSDFLAATKPSPGP